MTKFIVGMAVVVMVLGSATNAAIYDQVAVKDISVESGDPDASFGIAESHRAYPEFGGPDGKGIRPGLFQFDLSSIPTGSTIISATLHLYLDRINNAPNVDDYKVSRLLPGKSWYESDGYYSPAPAGHTTWNNRIVGTAAWDGGGAGGALDVDQAGSIYFDVVNEGSDIQLALDITSFVTQWVTNGVENNGLVLRGGTYVSGGNAGTDHWDVGHRENSDPAQRPSLTIEWTGGTPQAPIIAEVSPDPDTATENVQYTKQLILLQGYPAPSWSVVQGPTGAQVSQSGLVSGWMPGPGDVGQEFNFNIRATNSEGSDDEGWKVLVVSGGGGILLLDDPLQGSTIGTQEGGTFVAGGWQVSNQYDCIYWHVTPCDKGAFEYDVKGLGVNCSGGAGDKNELSHMYDWTYGNADTVYDPGYRNNPYKHFIRKQCGAGKENTLEIVWVIQGNGLEDDTAALSWDAATTYHFRCEWENTGINGILKTYRNDQLVLTQSLPGSWTPAGLSVRIAASPRRADEGAHVGAIYSNVKVYGLIAPGPPIINDVADAFITPGVEYTQQCSLSQGTPPVSWSLLQGPTGAVINSSTGRVSGWTPETQDMGLTFPFQVQATNAYDGDTEEWNVTVNVSGINNGFNTDYIYVARSGQIRVHQESDATWISDFPTDGTNSLTFSGKGTSDARLFTAQSTGTDIIIHELDAAGNVLKSVNLSTLLGAGQVGPAIDLGNIRYSEFSNTLFIGANTNNAAMSPAMAWEVDLELTTLIATFTGPNVPDRPVNVAINPQDGTLYMTSRHLGDPTAGCMGDLVAFDTTGGSTTSYITLIEGSIEFDSTNWNCPSSPIYRGPNNPSKRPTILILTNWSTDANAVLEYYLDEVDGNGHLVKRGQPTVASRGWNGQLDTLSGAVWIAELRYADWGVLYPDDTSQRWGIDSTYREYTDIDSPPYGVCNVPFADADGDLDVDQDDFAVFQLCFTGEAPLHPPIPSIPFYCGCFNRESGGDTVADIDTKDFNAFQACASGPGIAANPACED